MKRIVLFGAGKSAYTLINYMAKQAEENEWVFCIADLNASVWKEEYDVPHVELVDFNLKNESLKNSLIEESDLVIS
ncbi:MAG: saccharopine dehydrogenase-like NADP-dependent oxidoreductase, partial [Bacteroidia bacterium]